MDAEQSKRYSHDGLSFRSFRLALSWPYCAHFPVAPQCGGKERAAMR